MKSLLSSDTKTLNCLPPLPSFSFSTPLLFFMYACMYAPSPVNMYEYACVCVLVCMYHESSWAHWKSYCPAEGR